MTSRALGFLVPLVLGCTPFGGKLADERLEHAKKSPEFNGTEFVNAVPTNKLAPGTFWEMLHHQFFGDEVRVPLKPVSIVARVAKDYVQAPASGLRATWIGHATVLVEIDGARFLTDPIWSDRCSPYGWVGPERFFPPPLPLKDVPKIDAVIISHDHYDHLDMATVQELASRGTPFVVPLGIGAHLEEWDVPAAQIHELDWGGSITLGNLTLTATPARHYSGRNPLHNDETLWASWVVQGPKHKVFFSGDTGYYDGFKKTGATYGPFDLALLKIGASDPAWQEIHMTPEEAVQVFHDVRGGLMLPVHWGTFNLAYHDWNQPADAALAAAQAHGVPLVIPRPGEFVDVASPPKVETWWR